MDISFKNVTKKFGIVTALKDIDLFIGGGEFVFILGSSGSGKTTLLKLIINQIKPSSGQISVGGSNLASANFRQIEKIRSQVGVIFQDYQLIFDHTVEENISLALDIVNYSALQVPQRIDWVLKKVGLSQRRFLFPSQLSGGELQRTALARALAIEPKIILADEPTGNLDSENAWNLIKLLKNINDHHQATILITTHDKEIVSSLAKRTITLRQGQIISDTATI
jgi:cell division transport system ATP-binding protein